MATDAQGLAAAGDWPDEFYLEGPVPGGDDLLLRTVAKVRKQSVRSARRRAALVVASVALFAVLVGTLGMAIGRWTLDPSVPMRVVASDPTAGVRMDVTMTASEGGTYLTITVTGLPIGTDCHLTLIGKHGRHLGGGSWQVGPDAADRPVNTTTLLRPSAVADVDVTTSTGVHLVGTTP